VTEPGNNLLEPLKGKKFRPIHRQSFIRNWTVHNLISHPLMEVIWWIIRPFSRNHAERASNWIHDITVPRTQEEKEAPSNGEEGTETLREAKEEIWMTKKIPQILSEDSLR
jgi:hypothetical protein